MRAAVCACAARGEKRAEIISNKEMTRFSFLIVLVGDLAELIERSAIYSRLGGESMALGQGPSLFFSVSALWFSVSLWW